MEELILRRTRAKTPVFRVGQLELKQPPNDANVLAERYQALLPARLMSPFVEVPDGEIPDILHTRTIRKIKRQDSLRSLMKKHSRDGSISDTETLVGSTPTSPLSPSYPKSKHDLFDKHVPVEELDLKDSKSSFDNDMALKICMDLLTNELSTAIAGEPTARRQSSGLQILLMIESYERVQQHLREEKFKSQAGGKGDVQDVERILEYWLKVLYSVYDRSYEHDVQENEEHFPLPLSVSRPPVRHPGRSSRDYGVTFARLGGDVYDREGVSF